MKRLELKNKLGIKITAASLCAVILGTSLFAVGANAKKGDEPETTVESTTEEEETVDSGNGFADTITNSMYVSTVDADKEETVYVIADASGKASQVIVSEHLLNKEGKDVIKDKTTLSGITNVKGDETFTQDGDDVEWQANGKEIYYQGTTDKEVPITQKVTYYLDGEEKDPSEMAGVSGKVTIRFDYENNAKYEDVNVPFVAITGLILNDSFSHIEISDGRIIEDGNSVAVIGYAIPGMKESLNAPDVNIPDYFEITADVEDFELEATMTVVANLGSVSLSGGSFDASSLDETVQSILGGINQLADGANQLAEGSDTLHTKFGEYKKGVKTLTDGMQTYINGAASVHDGIAQVKTGVDTVSANMPTLANGVTSLMNGANNAYQGSSQLVEGMAQLHDGINKLTGKVENMAGDIDKAKEGVYANFKANNPYGLSYEDAKSLLSKLETYRDKLTSGDYTTANYIAGQLNSAAGLSLPTNIAAIDATAFGTLKGVDDKIIALKDGLGQVNGAISALDGVKGKVTGSETSEGIGALKNGAGKIETGIIALNEGLWTLYDGTRQLNDGTTALVNGVSQLSTGVNTLYEGSSTLVANNETLLEGTTKINSATDQLDEGIATLANGANQLNDGITKFREEGVSQVADGYVPDAEAFVDKLDTLKNAAKDYQSFAGINEDQQGTVKFIIRTAGIK